MTTLIAKYTSLKTAIKNGIDFDGFTGMMNDFGYETRINNAMDVVEVIDPETKEAVDFGHPIAIKFEGQTYYELMTTEMNSVFNLGGQWFDTIFDEVGTQNYPAHYRKCLRAARRA